MNDPMWCMNLNRSVVFLTDSESVTFLSSHFLGFQSSQLTNTMHKKIEMRRRWARWHFVAVCFVKGWGHLALHHQPSRSSFPHEECLLVVMGGGLHQHAAQAVARRSVSGVRLDVVR